MTARTSWGTRWRDEVNIVAAELILKVEHVFRQGMAVHLLGFLFLPALAYLVVLAIDTSHIAVAEEYRP